VGDQDEQADRDQAEDAEHRRLAEPVGEAADHVHAHERADARDRVERDQVHFVAGAQLMVAMNAPIMERRLTKVNLIPLYAISGVCTLVSMT